MVGIHGELANEPFASYQKAVEAAATAVAKDQMARAATELRTLCDSTVPDPGNQLLEIAVDARFDT